MLEGRRILAGMAALALLSVGGVLSISGCAALGERPAAERLARISQSPEWRDGRFHNTQPLWNDMTSALLRTFDSTPGDAPGQPVPVVRTVPAALAKAPETGLRVTWFGHSSTLIEIDGVRVLTDPIWSERPSPIPSLGPGRWYAPPIALADLPAIDAVLISHDHYDHLDLGTIDAMKAWKTVFFVPLGIGAHLARWGIPADRIVELDWWQSGRVGGIEVTATPARHASGRVSPQSNRTLWAGFALVGPVHRAYYSGDTGLLPAVQDIGRRLGPFDLTLIDAGQYDADWPDWHLGPEQAVDVHLAVRGKVMLPVHWGLFKLAHHGWTEPVERVLAAAACTGTVVLTPRPGQSIELTLQAPEARQRWWPAMPWRQAAQDPIVATKNGVAADRVAQTVCVEKTSAVSTLVAAHGALYRVRAPAPNP